MKLNIRRLYRINLKGVCLLSETAWVPDCIEVTVGAALGHDGVLATEDEK